MTKPKPKDDRKNLTSSLSRFSPKMSLEDKRFSLYGIYTVLILSKTFFPNNIDIRPFIEDNKLYLDEPYHDYIYRSRTLLMARILRAISVSDEKSVQSYLTSAKKLVFPKSKPVTNKNTKNVNYFDELFNQFQRDSDSENS